MRFQCTGLLFIATATLVLSAPTAQADTQYGGTGLYKGNRPAAPSISLLRRDNGQIAARVLLSASCRGWANHNMVIRVTGSTPDGASFTASGKTRLGPPGHVGVTLTGTLRARSTRHGGGTRWYPCDSGTQTWTARA